MLSNFAKVALTYGSFADPFLNAALSVNADEIWRLFFSSMKYKWRKNYSLALEKAEKALEKLKKKNTKKRNLFPNPAKYEKGKTIFYLLCGLKLTILEKMGDKTEAQNLYEKLRMEYFKMPELTRRVLTPILLNYYSIEGEANNSKPRSWSVDYEKDPISKTAMLLGKARNEIEKNGNLQKAISTFIKTYKVAKKIPQPMIVIESLNEIAWHVINSHPKWALIISKKATYWAGWYKENVEEVFYVLDTLFRCQKNLEDNEILDTARIISENSYHLFDGEGWGGKLNLNTLLHSCRKMKTDFGISFYKNTITVRNYLKKYVATITEAATKSRISQDGISDIFNHKSQNIRGYTLRKLINGLNIKFDLNAPHPIVNEFYKLEIESEFSRSMKSLKKLNHEEIVILFISTYMAHIERRKSLAHLSRKGMLEKALELVKDTDGFSVFMSKRYETMLFVNQMVGNLHPFLEARQDLAQKYLRKLSIPGRKKFISLYIKESEERRKVIDKFCRNYTRYDVNINWGIRVNAPKEIEKYVEIFHLKKLPASLAFWAFERRNERMAMLNFCQDLNRGRVLKYMDQ